MEIIAGGPPANDESQSNTTPFTIGYPIIVLFAVLDSAVPFIYWQNASFLNAWYSLTIAVKFLVCILVINKIHLGTVSFYSFYILMAMILISSAVGGSEPFDYVRILSFVISLFMTLSILTRQNLPIYMLTCVYTIGVSTLLYVFLAQTGHIDEDWGRFDYFGGNQPNLGTEIISISVIYASCVMPPVRLIAFSVPSIYAINLMQGRAGLIVSILAIAISLYTRIKSTVNRSMVGVVAIGVLIASLTIYNEETLAYFNSILLLDDEHRGVDTGYVGRGDLWEGAWRAFLQSPIVGNGAGFEERLGVNPHNYFLYGLALFGMLSIFIFGVIFYLFYELYRTNIRWFLIVIVISIMLVFNDRFFNLNPYPFLLYVILFAHSQDIVSPTITGPKHWAKILELYRQQPATRLPYSLMSRANR